MDKAYQTFLKDEENRKRKYRKTLEVVLISFVGLVAIGAIIVLLSSSLERDIESQAIVLNPLSH